MAVIPEFRRRRFINMSAGNLGVNGGVLSAMDASISANNRISAAKGNLANATLSMGSSINDRLSELSNMVLDIGLKRQQAFDQVDAQDKLSKWSLEYNRQKNDLKLSHDQTPEEYENSVAKMGKDLSESYLKGEKNSRVKAMISEGMQRTQTNALLDAKEWADRKRIVNAGIKMQDYADMKAAAINDIQIDAEGMHYNTFSQHMNEFNENWKANGKLVFASGQSRSYFDKMMRQGAENYALKIADTNPVLFKQMMEKGTFSKFKFSDGTETALITDGDTLKRYEKFAESKKNALERNAKEQRYLGLVDSFKKIMPVEEGKPVTAQQMEEGLKRVRSSGSKELEDSYLQQCLNLRREDPTQKFYADEGVRNDLAERVLSWSTVYKNKVKDKKVVGSLKHVDLDMVEGLLRDVSSAFAKGQLTLPDYRKLITDISPYTRKLVTDQSSNEAPWFAINPKGEDLLRVQVKKWTEDNIAKDNPRNLQLTTDTLLSTMDLLNLKKQEKGGEQLEDADYKEIFNKVTYMTKRSMEVDGKPDGSVRFVSGEKQVKVNGVWVPEKKAGK